MNATFWSGGDEPAATLAGRSARTGPPLAAWAFDFLRKPSFIQGVQIIHKFIYAPKNHCAVNPSKFTVLVARAGSHRMVKAHGIAIWMGQRSAQRPAILSRELAVIWQPFAGIIASAAGNNADQNLAG